MTYPYSQGELLDSPQTYRYTPFQGQAFVNDWRASRMAALRALPAPGLPTLPEGEEPSPANSQALLAHLCQTLRNGAPIDEAVVAYWLPRLLKKFEVTKRVYGGYEDAAPHRALPGSDYHHLPPYLLLAECLLRGWQATRAGYFLSGVLKLNDTLVSQQARLTPAEGAHLAWILTEEHDALAALSKELGL